MNIFSVLSMGKSRLHETSMSAMLGYLLNPYQDHGLGNKFLIEFLKIVPSTEFIPYINKIQNGEYRVEIGLEVGYKYEVTKRYDIDIQIKILNSDNDELHRILIENKIKVMAAQEKQLKKYYDVVKSEILKEELTTKLSVIFLTPKTENQAITNEYSSLDIQDKSWLYWYSQNPENLTIVKLIQEMLISEQKAEISPINEYIRHTLKAFAHFISYHVGENKTRIYEDLGEINNKIQINLDSEEYTVIKRESGQIQIFDTEEKQLEARPILRQYIESIDELNNKAKEISIRRLFGLTTRDYGNIIFQSVSTY